MKTLLKNGTIVNVFTDTLDRADVLLEDGIILGVGDYSAAEADTVEDVAGKFLCPGLMDGHIHIESTMLSPAELTKVCLPRGTTAIMADPHEIANVAGVPGIRYMLEASENLPMDVYVMVPSCVPATAVDETGAVLEAADILPLYDHPRVLGLGEMMNYPGVLAEDNATLQKINDAREKGLVVNGHAPLLTGKALDKYIAAGIGDDHECSSPEEAMERIRKGQRVMIRQGTAAKNLSALMPLFAEPFSRRCMLVTDDRHPADLLGDGHIDNIIRLAVKAGASPVTAIRMASIQTAEYFGLRHRGAIAPGYAADVVLLEELDTFAVRDVYKNGKKVVERGTVLPFPTPKAGPELEAAVRGSFHLEELTPEDLYIQPKDGPCRVIGVIPGELLTEERQLTLDFHKNNGIDVERDILKLAVIERHKATGHKGLGFIAGIGLRSGAIAASVSHDSHNLIVIGTNDPDMAAAANRVRALGGGMVVAKDGEILAEMPLPVGGLMTDLNAEAAARENEAVRQAVHALGAGADIEPFMNMAFISLPVIPALKMTTLGLVQVETQKILPLFVSE